MHFLILHVIEGARKEKNKPESAASAEVNEEKRVLLIRGGVRTPPLVSALPSGITPAGLTKQEDLVTVFVDPDKALGETDTPYSQRG